MADSMARIGVFPLDGLCVFRIGVDVAAEFACQVGHRGEHAAGDDVALDFGELQLDLIQPRGIGFMEALAPGPKPLKASSESAGHVLRMAVTQQ